MLRRRRKRSARARTPIREGLRRTGRRPGPSEGDELYLEALVRLGRAIEAAVECDEHTAAIPARELIARVEQHAVGRPVPPERQQRLIEARAIDPLRPAHAMPVATVLG